MDHSFWYVFLYNSFYHQTITFLIFLFKKFAFTYHILHGLVIFLNNFYGNQIALFFFVIYHFKYDIYKSIMMDLLYSIIWKYN